MAKTSPPNEIPVPPVLARELLNAVGHDAQGRLLGDALQEAQQRLQDLIQTANARVKESQVASLAATTLARNEGHKGHAEVHVGEEGDVQVLVFAGRTRRNKTTLPLLKELQEKARKMGVSEETIKEFGIKRRALHEYLEELVLTEDEEDDEDDEKPTHGPDEVKDLPSIEPIKRGFRKTSVAISTSEVDVDSLLNEFDT